MPPYFKNQIWILNATRISEMGGGNCTSRQAAKSDHPVLNTKKSIGLNMSELPRSGAGHDDATRKKIHAAVAARNLASASNNTKWDELINHFRQLQGWRPSYRSKSVTGYVSEWDVEWFDIGLSQAVPSKEGCLQVQPLTMQTKYRRSSHTLDSSLTCAQTF